MKLTTLCLFIFSLLLSALCFSQVSPTQDSDSSSGVYKVSSTYLLPELEQLSTFLQKDSSSQELFRDFSSQMNDLTSFMDKTNLELLIKVQFYRIFLNHAQLLKNQYPEEMQQSQQKLLKAKVKKLDEAQFTSWFMRSLLSDYDNLGYKTKSYITPWLKAFLVMSDAEWRKEIGKVSTIYFKKLLFHLNILNRYSLSKTNAPSQGKPLTEAIFTYQENMKPEVKSKSQSIDEINKKLPKSL